MPTDGTVHTLPLAEGFTLHVIPTRRFKTLTLRLALHLPLDRRATAVALLESILHRGCRGYPTMKIINRFLESLYGAAFSTDVSKIGDLQSVGFGVRVLNDRFAPRRVRSLELGLDFLSRVFSAPVLERGALRRDYFDQERDNLRRFLEGVINDRPGYAMLRAVEAMCPNEPHGIHEHGRLQDLAGLDPESITRLHAELVSTAPIDLFVVGDVSPEPIRRAARRIFKRSLRRGEVSPLPDPVRPEAPPRPREVIEELDVEQARLIMGWRAGVAWPDDDYAAFLMANGVFGGFPHSRLFRIVREEQGLAYQAASYVESTKGLMIAALGIDAPAFPKARDLVIRQWESIQAGKIGKDEFEKTRNVFLHHLRSRGDSPGTMIHEHLEGILNRRPRPPEELMRELEKITPERAAAAARKAKLDTIYLLRSPSKR
ncbi:MAG TPA: pitrilysin family protein [Planctomycetota bacterium]|nr:pitrilysin family protein [Planctomycetota bacterium]